MGTHSLPIAQRNHSRPLRGREVDSPFTPDRRPGDWSFRDSGSGVVLLVCPCGCDSLMRLRTYMRGTPPEATAPGEGPRWAWNGDRGRPTLEPSIRDLGGCRFHGHLTDGEWTFAPDSGAGAER